jgi:dimethylhistidine N-methyltransferase
MDSRDPTRGRIIRLLDEGRAPSLAEMVRTGLSALPKRLSCFFLYDDEGSRLFEAICDLPEYYLTRTELALLTSHAPEMTSGLGRRPELVELGSGSSSKTRLLIESLLDRSDRVAYVPIDISGDALREAIDRLTHDYPTLSVVGLLADYRLALSRLERHAGGTRLFAFLGSSLGNYAHDEAADLLARVRSAMGPSDRFLLGTDMVKDAATLEAAYDDAQGLTARFNRNLLVRINRELGADFVADDFEHRARYDELGERIEMHLVSTRQQTVRIARLGLTIEFAEGETIHTENSHKYSRERLDRLARDSGFEEERAWTDPQGWYRVQRWRPTAA